MTNSMTGAARVAQVRAMLDVLDPYDTSAESTPRLQQIAQLQNTLAALAAQETADGEALRHEEEAARGVPKSRRGHGFAAEIGLARGQSPARGSKHVGVARCLVQDMPKTFNSLALGQ